MTPPAQHAHDEGAVAVIVAILATTLLVFAAFAVDIGNAWAQSRQLSVSADSAALSAAKKVGLAMPANTDCTPQVLSSINATQIARTEADALNTANSPTGATEPVDGVSVACAANGDAVEVTISNSRGVKTQLAGIIGIDQIRPNSYAVARYFKTTTGGGLRPWAVCDDTVLLARADKNATFATGLDNQVGTCNSRANGNWGGVDFNGGANSAGDLAAWTQNGYPGFVSIPDPLLPADPGVSNSAALGTAFTSLVNQVVLFPTVLAYNEGSGNTATFDAIGVTTVQVCGIYYNATEYKTDSAGVASTCWVNPFPTPQQAVSQLKVTVSATPANKADVLTATAGTFVAAMKDANITIPGAGAGGAALVTTIKSVTSSTQVVLNDKASTTVAAPGADVTITYTTPGTPPLGLTLENNGNPIGHIQFRYVDYVSSYQGSSTAPPCDLANSSFCAGVVALWR